MARKESVTYQRERLELADGDFLDLDWLRNGHRRLIVLSAGMEGDSQRHYMKRTAGYFFTRGWDVLAWNYRSCSGELNRLPKLYSYADTDDFRVVIDHSIKSGAYAEVALIGFSMGGCLVKKYLGEQLPPNPRVVASVAFSVSCNLKDSMKETERSLLYNYYFINKIKSKLQSKAAFHPAIKNIPIEKINTFDDYLFHYTIPFHGFKDAADFYVHSSCEQFIASIRVPSLMVNALNDPILGNQCYPYKLAEHNSNFYLETPGTGGHLGFSLVNSKNSWMETRAYEFITSHMA
jgi:predicted alpha/beta-fold hydrolase